MAFSNVKVEINIDVANFHRGINGLKTCFFCNQLTFDHVIHICNDEKVIEDLKKCFECAIELTDCNWAYWIVNKLICRECIND